MLAVAASVTFSRVLAWMVPRVPLDAPALDLQGLQRDEAAPAVRGAGDRADEALAVVVEPLDRPSRPGRLQPGEPRVVEPAPKV
jgi:hypothetical protein